MVGSAASEPSLPPQLNTAINYVREGALGKAEALLRTYLRDQPNDVNAIRLLGEVGLSLGALKDAEQLLARAVQLAPDYAPARFAYANALYRRHRHEQSLEELAVLLATDPENPDWLTLQAACRVDINDHEGALPILAQITNNNPDHRQAWLSLGHAQRAVGDTHAAIQAYEEAIRLGSRAGEAWWSLANLKTYQFSDHQIDTMRRLAKDSQCDYRDYYHVLFALGKALEDRSEYQDSMAAYAKGNQVRARAVPWDMSAFEDDTRRICDFFNRRLFTEHKNSGHTAPDPIFVVGLPRAGSTLIEQILASHSMIEGTAELADIIAIARDLSGKRRRGDQSQYPQSLAALQPDQIAELGVRYIERTRTQRKTAAPFFVDKMPNNFSHVGLIKLILPNAKIVDARRHPMDCCFSGYKQLFASGQGFTYGLKRIGHYYRWYIETMNHWDEVLPSAVHRVYHEALLNDPTAEVKRLLDYCGLPFEEQCLSFHTTERKVRTASSEQVRQPLNRSGIGRWRAFETWLKPLEEALGDTLSDYPWASD